MMQHDELEQMAAILSASGEYRILRRLVPRQEFEPDPNRPTMDIVILDVEATGLDINEAEILELGMIRARIDIEGKVHRVVATFDGFQQPKKTELSDEITQLTGLTQEMVAGQIIDQTAVETFVAGAVLVVGHNVGYDRPLAESAFPIFRRMCWACSLVEIPWLEEGQTSVRLGDILAGYGYWHGAHRADGDCLALLEILSRPLPKSGRRALKVLLDHARQPSYRVIVKQARNAGTLLRKEGFRWRPGADEQPGYWMLETTERRAQLAAALVAEDVPAAVIKIKRITAFERFSNRF